MSICVRSCSAKAMTKFAAVRDVRKLVDCIEEYFLSGPVVLPDFFVGYQRRERGDVAGCA